MSELPSRNDCLPRVNSYNHSASTCLSDVILLIPPRTYTSLTGDHSIRRCKSKKKIFSHTSFLDDNVLLSIISPPNEPVLVPSPTRLTSLQPPSVYLPSFPIINKLPLSPST